MKGLLCTLLLLLAGCEGVDMAHSGKSYHMEYVDSNIPYIEAPTLGSYTDIADPNKILKSVDVTTVVEGDIVEFPPIYGSAVYTEYYYRKAKRSLSRTPASDGYNTTEYYRERDPLYVYDSDDIYYKYFDNIILSPGVICDENYETLWTATDPSDTKPYKKDTLCFIDDGSTDTTQNIKIHYKYEESADEVTWDEISSGFEDVVASIKEVGAEEFSAGIGEWILYNDTLYKVRTSPSLPPLYSGSSWEDMGNKPQSLFSDNETLEYNKYIYKVEAIDGEYHFLTDKLINKFRPFDMINITAATYIGDMYVKGILTHKSNAFTLANIIGDTVEYTVKSPTGDIVATGTEPLDCWLDDDKIYDQHGITKLIPIGQMVEINSTIEITIYNNGLPTQLGTFESNTVVDDGVTGFDIKISSKNYNDHTPDAWGFVELGKKAVVTRLVYTVRGEASKISQSHRRHRLMNESYSTVDATDIILNTGAYAIAEAVKRGIMTVSDTYLILDNDYLSGAAEYKITLEEIV